MATAAAKQATGEITTLLGRGATFDGKLTFEGTVRIDGTFKGEVFSNGMLVVGEGAHVEAEIEVGEIIIQGSIVGNITATRSIEIHAPGSRQGRPRHADAPDREGRDLRRPLVDGGHSRASTRACLRPTGVATGLPSGASEADADQVGVGEREASPARFHF